jgi:hypothetical protein
MKTIQVTLQERWAASRHQIHQSKKTYTRKDKHKNKSRKDSSFVFSLGYPRNLSYLYTKFKLKTK